MRLGETLPPEDFRPPSSLIESDADLTRAVPLTDGGDMCGILAIIAPQGIDESRTRAVAEQMTDAMTARGPDGRGLLVHHNVLLGHRRLAIRDLDGGRQPMLTADGRFAISYNGELYNDLELRAELMSRHGVRFRSRCDTETVLQAYAVWGPDCVERLRGMFAFVAADFAAGRSLIARDRCGVKPLFFSTIGETLLVASSVDALLRHPDIPRRPNFRTISHYISSFRLTLGRETMFDGIYQLQPGERMIVNGDHIRMERYWDLPDENATIKLEEAAEILEDSLDESVRRRQISDRPVGMLLSGGVDSAAIASSMSTIRGRFVARAAGEEVANAIETAEAVGCDLDPIAPTAQQFRDSWRDLLDSTSLPCSTPSDPVILSLSRSLKREVDVALGGEGADELLCGYGAQHWIGEDFRRQNARKIWRTDAAHDPSEILRSKLATAYGRPRFHSPIELFLAANTLVKSELKPQLLSYDAWRFAEEDNAIIPIYEAAAGENEDEPPSRKLYRMIHKVNLEGQLSRLDTATMQASLEARVPFTDHVLCEEMATVPFREHIRIRPGENPNRTAAELAADNALQTKRVLRSVARRRLPARIADRPKQSFPTPVAEYLTGPWANEISATLTRSPFMRELLRTETLAELAVAPERAGILLWPLTNLAEWGDRQFAA